MKKGFTEGDSALVASCINGERAAWSRLANKYSDLIAISARVRLKRYEITLPRQDIEDIRQNVLSALWKERKLEGVRNRRDISYWLAIVSGNKAMEYARKKRALEPKAMVSLSEKAEEKELREILPSNAPTPSDELARQEVSKRIDAAMKKLSAKERMIFSLSVFHDMGYREIADMMKLPTGTVSSCVKRVKEKLRGALKDLE